VKSLEREERPTGGRAPIRILDRGEIERLLAAADERYRLLLAFATFGD
jgi:hypothetical protein